MALYFPSLLRDVNDSRLILNNQNVLADVGQSFAIGAAARAIDGLLFLGEDSLLGPVGVIVGAIQSALFLVELFSQPTRIDVQKEVVEQYFDPLTHFTELNYCYPITAPYFKDMSSGAVQDALDRRPDLRELRDSMVPQAHALVHAGVGLGGYGDGMDERIVNQCLGNWERHGWSTQQVIDCWQGVLNAAEIGPQSNGRPPAGTAVAQAIAGYQVGALLYHKWSDGQGFGDDEWQMFTDYYVQSGFDMEAFPAGDGAVRWYTPFVSYNQGQPPTIAQPQVLEIPAQNGWFSPPCRQDALEIPPAPQPPTPPPPPTQEELDRACQLWIQYRTEGDISPEDWAWIATPRGKAAAEATRNDPRCYPPQQPPTPPPGPQPSPPTQDELDYACGLWIMYRTFGTLSDADWAWVATPRGRAAAEATRFDPRCFPKEQPPPTQPPQQPPPQQPPQPTTPYQQACQYWLLVRAGQPIPPALAAWASDPQNYPLLAQAFCDPQCGYDPTQPWPLPPEQPPTDPPEELCPKPCQEQIDKLKDQMRRTRPPWQIGCEEWPPRDDEQNCWQWPWPQQPWPPQWPQPWPCEWPPHWPKPPCDCGPPVDNQPPTDPPGQPPTDPPDNGNPPGDPPVIPGPPGCTSEYVQNFWDCIWPSLRDRVCDVARECQRQIDCLVIRWCEIARSQLGSMLECWALADTPEAQGPVEVGLLAQSPDQILTYQDQATNVQRSGIYARGIGIALAAQAAVLQKAFPQFEEDPASPTPIGFGVPDEQSQLVIRAVRPYPQETDPCAAQGLI